MPPAPLMVIIPRVLAALWLIIAESRRLPRQNMVALTLLSVAIGVGIEWGLTSAPDPTAITRVSAVCQWVVLLLGARALGRLLGKHHLFHQTLLTAACLAPILVLPSPMVPVETILRLASLPVALLVLAPWWIRKPLAPAQAPAHAALAAPLLATWISTESSIDLSTVIRTALAWLPALGVLIPRLGRLKA